MSKYNNNIAKIVAISSKVASNQNISTQNTTSRLFTNKKELAFQDLEESIAQAHIFIKYRFKTEQKFFGKQQAYEKTVYANFITHCYILKLVIDNIDEFGNLSNLNKYGIEYKKSADMMPFLLYLLSAIEDSLQTNINTIKKFYNSNNLILKSEIESLFLGVFELINLELYTKTSNLLTKTHMLSKQWRRHPSVKPLMNHDLEYQFN